jgi:hypothetical protein
MRAADAKATVRRRDLMRLTAIEAAVLVPLGAASEPVDIVAHDVEGRLPVDAFCDPHCAATSLLRIPLARSSRFPDSVSSKRFDVPLVQLARRIVTSPSATSS